MSRIADQVFNRLKAGESPRDVRKWAGSGSAYTDGNQRYLAWVEPEVTRLQMEIASLGGKLEKLRDSERDLKDRRGELQSEIEDMEGLADHLVELRGLVRQEEERLKGLQDHIQRLKEKGYSEEIVLKLSRSDAGSGGEMLQRVDTIEKYETESKELLDTLNSLTGECKKTSVQLKESRSKLHDLQEQVRKTTLRLRKRQDEERLFKAAVRNTKALMERYGLKDQDFKNIWDLTIKIGSPGMAGHTMENVKLAIQKYHTLVGLEAAIKGRSEALKRVEAELGKVEERLGASTKAFTEESKRIAGMVEDIQVRVKKVVEAVDESLENLKTSTVTEFRDVAMKGREEIETARKEAIKSLIDLMNSSIKSLGQVCEEIDAFKTKTSESITETQAKAKDDIGDLIKRCQEVLKEIQKASAEEREQQETHREEWGRIQAEAGKYAAEIQRANVILALEQDSEALRLIGKDEVELLLSRVKDWSKMQNWVKHPAVYLHELTSRVDIGLYNLVQFSEVIDWGLGLLRYAEIRRR